MATRYQAGREMTVGGVLSRGFGAIAAWPVLFGTACLLLVALPGFVVGAAWRSALGIGSVGAGAPPFHPILTWWPMLAGGGLVWLLLYLLAQAVLFRATVAALDGRKEPAAAMIVAALRTLPALFVLAILLSVGVWLATLLLVVPGVMLAMVWAVAAPVLVVERVGIFAALARSGRLTRGARWRIFSAALIVFVLYYMAAGIVGVGNLAARGVAAAAEPPVAVSILSTLLQAAFVAVWSAVQAAIYVDLRDARDGPAAGRLADIFA